MNVFIRKFQREIPVSLSYLEMKGKSWNYGMNSSFFWFLNNAFFSSSFWSFRYCLNYCSICLSNTQYLICIPERMRKKLHCRPIYIVPIPSFQISQRGIPSSPKWKNVPLKEVGLYWKQLCTKDEGNMTPRIHKPAESCSSHSKWNIPT